MVPVDVPMNMRRVIAKAIHRSSKPDLAIEVATEAGRRGIESVPTLLRKMFSASCGWHAGKPINAGLPGDLLRQAIQ